MGKTSISWATHTANWLAGCTKVSPACANCYALTMSSRQIHMAKARGDTESRYLGTVDTATGAWTGLLNYDHNALFGTFVGLLHARRSRRVFINSMSDTFHKDAPPESLVDLAKAIRRYEEMEREKYGPTGRDFKHVIMLLTKRPDRLRAWQSEHFPEGLPSWVWVGTTVEDQRRADERVPELCAVRIQAGGVRFLSMEPLLGPVDLGDLYIGRGEGNVDSCLSKIGWVIVGAESGPNARPMHPAWATSLRDQAQGAGVPFHFKQWGTWTPVTDWTGPTTFFGPDHTAAHPMSPNGTYAVSFDRSKGDAMMLKVGKHAAGRLLDGRTWDEVPGVSIFPPGTLVRVDHINDESDAKDLGKTGVVVDFDEKDCGATPDNPMHIVRFDDGHQDGFWYEELRVVPVPPAR